MDIKEVRLARDRANYKSLGFGFVEFNNVQVSYFLFRMLQVVYHCYYKMNNFWMAQNYVYLMHTSKVFQ